jgi:hypothetical protein
VSSAAGSYLHARQSHTGSPSYSWMFGMCSSHRLGCRPQRSHVMWFSSLDAAMYLAHASHL